MNSINYTSKATKQLRKISQPFRTAILDAVDALAAMPNCQNVKSLTNHSSGYRLRVGNYRVLFDWSGEIKIVEVNEIRKRDERTY